MNKLILSLLCFFLVECHSLIHHLVIHRDERRIFKIESFGFLGGGKINLKVSDFTFHTGKVRHNSTSPHNNLDWEIDQRRHLEKLPYKVGFILRHAESESLAQQDLEYLIERNECIFDKKDEKDIIFDLSNTDLWKGSGLEEIVRKDQMGMYSLIFAQCVPVTTPAYVSFQLDASFTNPGPNYLSAGDKPLPLIYFIYFFIFLGMLGTWSYLLFKKKTSGNSIVVVHSVHYYMLLLLVFKCMTLLCESIRYHYIALYGVSETWNAIYYVFAALKGVLLFVVILLIGTGYSLVRNYLTDQDKRILLIVLVLQVINNIAMVVLEENAPGSVGYITLRDILHLVDLICCLAIILPIVWSIRHLRQAAEVDGKAQANLVKLTQFRQFYMLTLMYIYFTRIAVYLLEATVPFYLLWLGPFCAEGAAAIFYLLTGYSFRPSTDNPYLPVRTEEGEGQEYGLDGDSDDERGLELPKRGV